MVCGQPAAAHTEPAEVIAARALLGDFQHAMHEFTIGTRTDADFLTWALRLGQHLQQVIGAVTRQAGPAWTTVAQSRRQVAADGSAWLTPADAETVRRALFFAAIDETVDGADGMRYDSLRHRLEDGGR